jgi:hypothetical protein
MTDITANTLFGHSPARYGLVSLGAVCLAVACWPLSIVLGFGMVYVAMLLAFVAVVSGLMGVGSGVYYRDWVGIVTGALGVVLICCCVGYVGWSLAHF